MDGKQTTQNISTILTEVNTLLSRPMDTKAVLCCPLIPLTNMTLVTWEIILEDKPACKLSYRRDTNETRETNCTDKRITWAFRPDQNPDLQIDPVAITHEGYYECIMAASDGNFHRRYHLQVLVPPEMTLFLHKNRTAVCKAVAGRPAAWISWSPEGDCVTEQEYWGNGTVTVWSSCRWSHSNVSAVTCSVLHLTGNKSLFIELLPGTKTSVKLYILYLILPIILIVVGSIWFLKISGYRKCELKKTEAPPVVEEDEMQPYASYTEKNNPLYDTTNRVKMSQVLQSEADGVGLHTV
ncbi:PREDICTED: cell surface glycoprotein CD200 receptor 1-like [Galeopterus variegatus]|uniref:Cell surface glycoprotein CD200 receptor 1-like n=1 Tax=Galeopterus variegatus TaxID=482537 RepID=A0ABM0S8U7_GALVR|nr:PREDICTED: cell surface glycoprotein CD200 receptor 1-like [Galeopterus variegatus]